jgi:hypothetical protein
MSRSARLLAFLLSLAGLAGLSSTVLAGTTAGRAPGMGQINQVGTGVGSIAGSGLGTLQGLNVTVQPGAADVAAGITSPNAIAVQTNIDNSRTIDASSNINVTDTVNGSNVSYGGNGASINWPQANALAVIDGVASFDAGISANNGPNWTAVNDALQTATFLNQQERQNN